jgi:hypothetical protein
MNIHQKYQALGGANGSLGAPQIAPDGIGHYRHRLA